MASFGKTSKTRLGTCHIDLQLILNEAIKLYDFTVLEGHRTVVRQQKLFISGKSKIDGIKKLGKHNHFPSMAVDIAPWKINWEDSNRFFFLAGIMFAIAERLYSEDKITHKLRWGHDWDNDKEFEDQTFMDSPHFELIKTKK